MTFRNDPNPSLSSTPCRYRGRLAFIPLIWLGLSSLCFAQTRDEQLNQLNVIRGRIIQTHNLSNADRTFLISAAKVPDAATRDDHLLVRQLAILYMGAATAEGLMPRNSFIRLIETVAVRAEHREAALDLKSCELLMNILPPDGKLRHAWITTTEPGRPTNSLDQVERQFIVTALGSKPNQALAGELLVIKRGMDRNSAVWAEKRLRKVLRDCSPATRPFWELVGRIVTDKNALPPF